MTQAAGTTLNPGHLKIDLALRGVRLDASVREQVAAARTLPESEGLPNGIELVLPDDVWASVPIDDSRAAVSPYVLAERDHAFVLETGDNRVEVRVVPQPEFYRSSTAQGMPMWKVGKVYGNALVINPAAGCGYSVRGAACSFCAGGEVVPPQSVFAPSVEDVTDVVRAAFGEGAAELVYFTLGYTGSEDGGIEFLEPYVRAVKRHFDTVVAVQLHPPADDRWIDRTYAIGVDALSYNLEVYDERTLAQCFPGRAHKIGRQRYYAALQRAAAIFPRGTVWSELVVGLEAPESTMQGIDQLSALGVLPVLSLKQGHGALALGAEWSVERIAPVYEHLFHAVRKARVNMGWVRDLSFAVTPLEARFFAGDDARVSVAMQQFYRSRLGNLAARNLSRLRRRLRVRRVSDSFDSSHL